MKQNEFDIVVVGASFSGLTFAHHIDSNLKVLIIDKKKKINTIMESTGLITKRTKSLLDKFIKNTDQNITNEISGIGILNTKYQHFFSYSSSPWLYTTDTPNLLQNMANQVPNNIKIRTDTKFLNVEKHKKKSVVLNIKKGNENLKIKTKFLIGADGARSEVAKQIGLSQNKKFLIGLEKVFEGKILLPEKKPCVYHCWFGEFALGYGGWFSPSKINDKDIIRIGLAKHQKGAKDLSKINDFVNILKEKKIIKLTNNKELDVYAGTIPVSGPLSNIQNDYCLLLGDAGGFCGAWAADGIKGAIISGKVGAEFVSKYLNNEIKSLKKFRRSIQKQYGLMTFLYKQLFYRFCWERMKSDSTFDALFEIINSNKTSFLKKFCDSRDKGNSLFKSFVSFKNLKLIGNYSKNIIFDTYKSIKTILKYSIQEKK